MYKSCEHFFWTRGTGWNDKVNTHYLIKWKYVILVKNLQQRKNITKECVFFFMIK